MTQKFVHLHVHSEYSLLDGLSKTGKIIDFAKENSMDSIALTDHGAMYGIVEFYKKAKKADIKPILGIEAYTTDTNMKERPERGKFKNFHLILLAKNNEGYKNLMKISSKAHLEGYYYRPRIDHETLMKYSAGLICTSACPQGEVAQALISGDYTEAKKIAIWYLETFESDYYLEIQRHKYDEFAKKSESIEIKNNLLKMHENEETIFKGVLKLSRELGIPIIATNDSHYIKPEDATAQDALVCIATGKNVTDTKRMRFIDTPTFHLSKPDEMFELFSDIPEVIKNTVKVAQKCNVNLVLDKWFFPNYNLEKGKTADSELVERANEGLKLRINKITKEVKERLDYELTTITKKGYSTYFLIVADMARWAEEHGIITNTRGSTAGSLVAYALRIVNINPLNYDLPFERFLTPWRPSPPDIDFDISDSRREEVINYITDKYGKDRVAQICTFGRMMAKGSVRDIARVLGYPYATGDRISKLIPIGSQGFPMSIKTALEITPDLKRLYDEDSDTKKVVDLARELEGNARHISVHAAGIVIAPDEITNFTPIQLDPEGKKVITQYDMDSLDPNMSPGEAVGLLKFDLLGLRNLSILGAAVSIVRKYKAVDVNILDIPLNDKITFEMLSRGETMGVFQLSGPGMTRYLKELKPTRVEDLMAMVALYRPGPMAQIAEYIERKNNPSRVNYFDPRMKEYLGKSYGLLVYQDDVFMTAINIAGYTWEEADKFRKAVGKKIPQEMEKQKEKFIKGAITKGLTENKATELFHLIEPFSGYGFNKAHAASYGMLAYQTAYMKANFPVEYMTALLTAESGDTGKVSQAINECKRMKVKILPPHINESDEDFTIVEDVESLSGKAIRFGLNAIKNVGKAAIESILEARESGFFNSLADFCSKVDTRKVNKKVLESLIKVGALSQFGERAALLSTIDEVRLKSKPIGLTGQQGLFSEEKGEKEKVKMISKIESSIPEFSPEELQQLERQLLGFSLSSRPIDAIIRSLRPYATHKVYEISPEQTFGDKVAIAGIIAELRIVITKKSGSEMAFARIEDETGSLEGVIFPRIFQQYRALLTEYRPVLICGRIDVREESPSLIVDTIETPETVTQKGARLQIKIPRKTDQTTLVDLKKLLISYPGNQKVTLVFEGNSEDRLDLPFGVSWEESLSRLISEVLAGSIVSVVE
ncbi:DNA polymerase III subunit alpha [Candidatus Woesebacteria bacterium RIFCSPHIGHO2_01_FULL_39_28]|uniref:DNA polymerase III subunit alpha n=1 Tax=Candidatus Woesebacteria bacterium RIFCSPHIGHO2_01_FULL_39_28 TaxID=1802496 RepID=A0A1F7YKZ4_9BACT|nr:MAG: DNA polymerase III subunit alpha [Candidatus Woesebacteria bacterium RIFCSPHIGHO2_01_FULL_39_28]OGM56967.1 MAG: DNA polymerase III subunit alpha [Candidatus Woesebacteria bacterium RIFCSPLOWO2_01_FULL_38_20]